MKKNIFTKMLVIVLILFPGKQLLRAQYTIVPYAPAINFTHIDLWHFSITGLLDTTMAEYYVSMRIFNNQNTLLVKSQSSVFSLVTPNLYVSPANLGPLAPLTVSYTVDGFYNHLVNTGGMFPAGIYHIDYMLYGRPKDGEYNQLSEYNTEANVEGLFPPLLISVENQDTICEPYPVFTWTPAYQASGMAPLTYHFRMVEVSPFQSAYQATVSNPLFYSEENIPITMLTYPTYASALVKDQQYAWQTDAVINNQVAASSEIWTFVYGCPSDTIIDSISLLPYVKLRTEMDGGVAKLTNKFLYVNYSERYFPGENASLSYKVYNTGTNKEMDTKVKLALVQGENYYIISTCGDGLDLKDGTYKFEVTDLKGKVWYMHFIKENTDCN